MPDELLDRAEADARARVPDLDERVMHGVRCFIVVPQIPIEHAEERPLLLPNVLWQATHHWISLEFYRQATRIKNVPTSPLGVLVGQLEIQGVVGMAATLVATLWLVRQPRLRAFAIALCLLMLSGLSRSDRIMGLYPAMFAASGV